MFKCGRGSVTSTVFISVMELLFFLTFPPERERGKHKAIRDDRVRILMLGAKLGLCFFKSSAVGRSPGSCVAVAGMRG